MIVEKSELIELFKAGRPMEELQSFVAMVTAIPENGPEEDQEKEKEPDDASKAELESVKAELEKVKQDLTAAQQANLKKPTEPDKDPMEEVRELFRKA